MKRFIVCLCLVMVSFPSVSYSVDSQPSLLFKPPIFTQLMPITKALLKITTDLLPIQKQLGEIARSCGASDPPDFTTSNLITTVLASIRMVSTICGYEFDLLSVIPYIMEEQKMKEYKYRAEKLPIAKEQVLIELDTLSQSYYALMTNNAALQQVDKAQDIIRPVLELFDKASAILQYHMDWRETWKNRSETGSR